MKSKRKAAVFGIWLAVAGLFAGCATGPRPPLNLSTAKAAVVAYVEDGRYDRDLTGVATEAQAWVTARAARARPGERLAVVFDIDETVLSNLPNMRAQDFGYQAKAWDAWVARAEAPALAPVREIYRTAQARGVAVLFLTGRRDSTDRAATDLNLRRAGLGVYAALAMAPDQDDHRAAATRKAARRAAWTAEGWTIIASIGDQESDLAGGSAERTFKLPNPFYLIP